MQGDGDGWVRCEQGHRHWGRYGAAGLLLRHRPDTGLVAVLLQHRALWSHHGGTWGLPGGARDSGESAEQAALREAVEETGLDVALVRVDDRSVDDHGGWSYTTVIASVEPAAAGQPPVRAVSAESVELRWVAEPAVNSLPLHPGFAASWRHLAEQP